MLTAYHRPHIVAEDFTGLLNAAGAANVVDNEELVVVAGTYIRIFDGTSTTTLLRAQRVCLGRRRCSACEAVKGLLGQEVIVCGDSNGGFML